MRDPAIVKAVIAQRTAPPWFGKDKIAVLLRRRGWKVSASAVGRILADAKRRGALREPPRPGVARRKPRPYAVRKPKTYRPTRPGDLVQIDTLDVRPAPGVILKHFTARDVVSRCDVLQVGAQATSASAARFLDAVVERMRLRVLLLRVLRVAREIEVGMAGERLPRFTDERRNSSSANAATSFIRACRPSVIRHSRRASPRIARSPVGAVRAFKKRHHSPAYEDGRRGGATPTLSQRRLCITRPIAIWRRFAGGGSRNANSSHLQLAAHLREQPSS